MKQSVVLVFVLFVLLTLSASAANQFEGFIGLQNGYFYDRSTGEPWVPHGIAYQTWNRPLGVWQTPEQIDYDLDEMVKMGANSIRVDFVWKHVEESGDNVFEWDNYDYLVRAAEERGIRIFALIGYQWPPDWFPDEWYTQHPPAYDSEGIYHSTRWQSDIINYEHPQARAQYAEWFSNVCGRYKDSKAIVGWIIGNESGYLGLWSGLQDGYDPESEAAFRVWCQAKYGTITNLNATWGTTYTGFTNIVFVEEYREYGSGGAEWADMVQWREDSIGSFTAVGAVAAKAADTNHLISYSTVGMQWGEEDWRYHAEDRGKITAACAASNAPIDFFSVNNYPWSILGHESQNGQWGISFTKFATRSTGKPEGVPVLYSETGFSSSETMWPGMNQWRQGPLVRNALWESLECGAIGTHIFSWMDRPYITDREKGFGILTADRRTKASFWTSRDTFNLMNQVGLDDLLMASKDPKPDIAFLWTAANDSQYNRYECEMQQMAGAFERLGFEPNFINLNDLAAGAYTNYKVLVLPRNMRVDRTVPGYTNRVLNFLRTKVIPKGVHILASADLPGMQDANGNFMADFSNEVKQLFGIEAGDIGGFEVAPRTGNYIGSNAVQITVTFTNTMGALTNKYRIEPYVWKYNDEVRATNSSLIRAMMDTRRNKGFEDNANLVGWWTWGSNITVSKTSPMEGTNCLMMKGTSGIWQEFPVAAGGRYTASAYFRSLTTNPLNGAQAYVAIEWRDAAGGLLGTAESAHLATNTTTNAWVRYAVDAYAPEGAIKGRRVIRVDGANKGALYVDNYQRSPALVVKSHGTAKTAIFLYSAGDMLPDGNGDGLMDPIPWKWRYDIFGSVLTNYFAVQPAVSLGGSNAYLCMPEYRTLADGSTLWQIKNYMYDQAYPASWTTLGGGPAQTFTIRSALFTGRTVKALSAGNILATNSGNTITLTLEPDGMEMLHVYSPGTNRQEIVQLKDAPSLVHPLGDKAYQIKVNYDCRQTAGLTLKVVFMENGDNGDGTPNEVYQELSIPVSGAGEYTNFWMWIPDANQNDPDYISTEDGGQYQFVAQLVNAGGSVVAQSKPIATQLKWGVRPTAALPTTLTRGETVEIPIEWEDLYEYLSWETTPLTRSSSFPNRIAIFRSKKTQDIFPNHYDRVNAVADWLENMGYSSGNPLDISFDNIMVQSGPVAPPAAQAHWAMNEGSGTAAADDSGNGYNGSISGAVAWVEGKSGQALNCVSNTQFMNVGPVDISNTWSIAAWFKYPLPSTASWNTLTRGSSTDHQIIVQRSGLLLGTYVASAFRTSGYSMTNLSAGWHHIVAVGTGSVTRFYIDGVQVGSANYQSTSDIKAIGNYQGGSQQFGTIDEVAIYNSALSDAQIAGEYAKYGPSLSVVHFQDTFGDGDYAGWQRAAGSGNWGVSANSLRASRIGNDDNMMKVDGLLWGDCTVSADIRYNVLGPYFNDAELYVRFVDRDNFVKVGLRNFYGAWRLMGVVKVGGCIQENKILYNFAKTNQPVAGTWFNLKAEVDGDNYVFYLNNQALSEGLTVANLSSGSVAVGAKAGQLGIWEPQKGYYFIDDDEYSYYAPEGQPTPACGTPLDLDWGYLSSYFPTLILPGTYVMSDAEVSNVCTWITNGLFSLIVTDGGVATMNENGEYDIGRIEPLFGVESFVYQDFNVLSNLLIGATEHYVTLDYVNNWQKQIGVSGTAKPWPQLSTAAGLATLYGGSGNVPALLANKLTPNPSVPQKVFCFNFDAAANGMLTNKFAQRAFEWTQGETYKVTLELKYNNGNPNYDPVLYSTTAWILSDSGSNTLVMELPSTGIMTGTNLYWVMYVYPWDADDPWLSHGGFYSSLNDGINVSIDGQGLQILGITDKAFAGRDWDMWVAYNTTGQPVTATYGIKDKTVLLFEETFEDGDIAGWGLESAQNYSISWADGAIRAQHSVSFGYAKFRHYIGPLIRSRNCTLEFDVLYETPDAYLSILYQDRGPYSSPAIPALIANSSTTGIWHHVELNVHDGWVYDYAVNGDVVRLNYALPGLNPNYQEYIGFFAFDGDFRIDNIRLTDQEYSSVPISICGEMVPTNSSQAFWASIPDYDPDQLEHNGTLYGAAYEWYVQFKQNQMEARQDVAVYFAPRLRDEETNFPTLLQPVSIAKVPVDWEGLDGLVPAKMRIELSEPIFGLNIASADFDITTASGADEFPVGVPGQVRASDYYLWAAYIYPTNATDPMTERIGLDDTFRFDMYGRPVGYETKITVNEVKGDPYVLYDDTGLMYHGQVFTWGSGSFNGTNTDATAPEGEESFKTTVSSSYAGWGIFKYYNGAAQYADMRTFSNGTLCFWMNATNTVKVELEGPKGTKSSMNLVCTNGSWQEFRIPITNFPSVNLSTMYGLFLVTRTGLGTYYLDDIRWEGATTPSNLAPVVSAGSDLVVTYADGEGRAMVYGAVADDGLPSNELSVAWSQVDGPASVAFSTTTNVHTEVVFPMVGTYVLGLTASDGDLTGYDEVSIIVDSQPDAGLNQAPNTYAGADAITVVANAYQLNGVITDDGLPSNVIFASWCKVSGPGSVTFGNATEAQTTAAFSEAGTYILRLTGFDGQLSDSDEVTITVEPYIGTVLENGDSVSGSIDAAGETDAYVFYGRPGDVVTVRMGDRTGSSSFDLYMTLLGPAGNVMATATGEQNAEITETLVYEGYYTIECKETDTTTGGYAISLVWLDAGHDLSTKDSDLGEIRNGQSKAGTINQAGDMDMAWFTAATGDVVKIRIGDRTGSSSFVGAIYLYGPDGQYIASASGDQVAEIVTTITSNGTYQVECRETDVTTGGYALSILWRDSGHELYEDLDLQEIENGQTLVGTINLAGDMDAAWFNAAAGDVICIRGADRTGSSSFNLLVSLYGPNGETISSASGSGDVTASFTVTITNSGPYLVECRETDVTTGSYSLSAIWEDGGHAFTTNNPCLGTLENGATLLGTISTAGEMDAALLTVEAGDVVCVRGADRTGSSSFVLAIDLFDENGVRLANNSGDVTTSFTVTFTNAGTYMVRCYETDTTTGNYSLSAIWEDGGHAFSASDPCLGTLENGSTLVGNIDQAGDMDGAWLTVEAGDVVCLRGADRTGSSSFVLAMDLFDENGVRSANASGDVTTGFTVTFTNGGTYLVRCYETDTTTGGYSLSAIWQDGGHAFTTNNPCLGTLENGATLLGTISTAGEMDGALLPVEAGDVVCIRGADRTGSSSFVLVINLIAPDGTILATASGDVTTSITTTFTNAGTYLVRCYETDTTTGNYSLSAIWEDGGHAFSASDPCLGTLENGSTLVGNIDQAGDMDGAWLTVEAGDVVCLRGADRTGSSSFVLAMDLFDENGVRSANASGDVTTGFTVTFTNGGTYLVRCYETDTTTGGYSLSAIWQDGGHAFTTNNPCLGTLENGATLLGTISTAGEMDGALLPVEAGDVVCIRGADRTGSSSFVLAMNLIDPDGTIIASASGDVTTGFTVTFTNAGTYLVRCYETDTTTGNYSLSVIWQDGGHAFSASDPCLGTLENGATLLGNIDQAGDMDGALLPVEAGDVVCIRGADRTGSSSFVLAINLIAPDGTIIASASGDVTTSITATFTNSGTYLIRCYETDTTTGGYSLTAMWQDGGHEFSASDPCLGTLENGATLLGSIGAVGDMDGALLTAEAGDVVCIRGADRTGSSSFVLAMNLIDPNGTIIASASGDVTTGFTVTFTNAGTYLVRCYETDTTTGNYSLSAIWQDGGHAFSASDPCLGTLENGATLLGNIDQAGDMDGALLTVGAGDVVYVRGADRTGSSSFVLAMDMFNENGVSIASSSGDVTAGFTVTFTNAGTYLVRCYETDVTTGGYSLSALWLDDGHALSASDTNVGGLTNGVARSGTIGQAGDVDAAFFSATNNQAVTVLMTDTTGSSSFVALANLYGPDGKYIIGTSGNTSAQFSTVCTNAGQYTILLMETDTTTGGYTVKVTY